MSVADILQQLAANAGNGALRRGQIYGDLAQGVANVPAQILNQREADRLLARGQARMDAQDARGAAADARQTAGDQRDQAAQAEALRKQTALKAGIAAGFGDDPDPKNFHVGKAAKVVIDAGYPDLVATISDVHDKLQPKLTSGAPGSVMRGPDGQVIPGSAIPEKKPDYTVNGQRFSGDGTPIGDAVPTQAAPKAIESKAVLLDGKPALVNYNPTTGRHALPDGTDVSTRVKPIPPASAQTGPNGAAGSLDEDGLEFAATAYRLTRQLPARNAAQNGAIISRAAKQAKDLGASPAVAIQRQAAYKADAGSLDKIQKMSDAAESFETKALGQADIVAELSKKVGRTGSPILNGWLLEGKDKVLGDSDTHQLFNAVSTFSAEYAKIMEGSTGSAAGSSDSARKASERLISAAQTKGSMVDTLALMRREMRLTIGGYGATIGHITERMGGAAPIAPPPPAAGGLIEATDPQGNIHHAAAGTALPAGWTLVVKP